LATSREPLGAIGERVVPIPSLALADAAALFRDRAVAADESVVFSDTDNDAVRRICERLDGIPLAIELAAARVRSHTMSDLAARLDDRFRLLRGSGRGGLERHQTLRAAVAWSYQLLSETERALFDRVSVFAGGFDLDAAEAVCSDESVDAVDVDDILGSLVDKSMVLADRSGAAVRFSLLETLRQYGEERLAERGESAQTRDRHFAYYLDVARDAYRLQLSPRQVEGEAVFEREWDNMRAAQAWAMAIDAFDAADELLRHTVVYALHRLNHEYIAWVERLLATDSDGATRSSRTYEAGGAFALWTGDFNRSVELCQQGIARNSAAHDVAECWATMASAYEFRGEIDNARAAIERAESMHTTDARVHFFNLVVRVLVDSADESADITEAVNRVWDFSHEIGAPWMINWSNYLRGFSCFRDGDRAGALAGYRATQAGALATRAAIDEILAASGIIWALLTAPDAQPTPECHQLLHRLHDARNWGVLWIAVEAVAYHLAIAGETEAAARIVGYLQAHAGNRPTEIQLREQTLEVVRRHSRADEWISQGAATDRDEIITHLFDQLPSPTG
jgi:predicted ATPase